MTCHTYSAACTCDGTSALKPQAAGFVVLEGGAQASRSRQSGRVRPERPVAGLSRGQELLFALACGLVVAAVVLASLASDALAAARVSQALSQAPVETVTVSQGDSLWAIASQRPQRGVSTAELVSWIEEANGLEGPVLSVGESLVVPVAQQS